MDELSELLKKKIRVVEEQPNKYSILFPMYRTNGGIYHIKYIKENTKTYLTDEGSTYAELDKIFELTAPDVAKNLNTIAKQYHCYGKENSLCIECAPNEIHIKLSYLIQAISFMLNMKIFYVTLSGDGYNCECKRESEMTGLTIRCPECEGGNLWGLLKDELENRNFPSF